MRRHDKKKHIEKLNKRLNENKFSWDGTYANEEDLEESTMSLGADIEIEEGEDLEEDCGCKLNQPEPTDVEKSQWFSDVDGERLSDMELD